MAPRGRATVLAIVIAIAAGGVPGGARAQTGPQDARRPSVGIDRESGQSIDDLVALALRQAPDALAARARIDEARGDLTQAALRPNPSLSFERRDGLDSVEGRMATSLEWPLDLFRRDGRVALARTGVDAADAAAAERDRQLAAGVRLLAARVLAAVEMLAIKESVAASNRQTLELITARAAAGATPEVDRDVAAVESARSEVEVRRQRAEVDVLAAELRTRLGLTPDQPLRLRDSLEDAATQADAAVPRDRLAGDRLAEALGRRPDIRVADAGIARAIARQDLARREGRTDARLFAGYMRMTGPTGVGANQIMAGVMVMLPWRNRNQGAVAAAAAESEAARHDRSAGWIEAMNAIEALRQREAAARDAAAIFAAGGGRSLAAKNGDVLRESYELGRATLLDVLVETRRRLDFETAYVATLLELVEARVELAAALGGGR
jgi:cobalt-zinc-cadmium efflux system outer membrane protein